VSNVVLVRAVCFAVFLLRLLNFCLLYLFYAVIYARIRLTTLLSGTTWVSRQQKGKTGLDFTEARDSEWQWHQLGHMQVCTSLQTPPFSFFTGRMPFLPPNQQRQNTGGEIKLYINPAQPEMRVV